MNLCIKIPTRLKFKRFNKKYAKLKYVVDHNCSNITIQDSPQFICGLKALDHGFMTSKLLNSAILFLRRSVGKGRAGWPRVRITFNLKVPITKKSEGHRMGKGKGPVRSWGVPVKSGSFVFKIHKSPRKSFFFQSFDWTHIFSFFELLGTISSVYDNRFALHTTYQSSEVVTNLLRFNLSFKSKIILFSFLNKLKPYFFSFFTFLKNLLLGKNVLSGKSFLLKIRKMLLAKSFATKNAPIINFSLFFRIFLSVFVFKLYFRPFIRSNRAKKFNLKKHQPQILELLFSRRNLRLVRTFYCFFFLSSRRFFVFNRKTSVPGSFENLKQSTFSNLQNVAFLENTMLAERTQRLSETKISYLPSLFRGLRRIKKKMPFPCEFFFVDTRNCGYSFYSSIKKKRTILKQLKQR